MLNTGMTMTEAIHFMGEKHPEQEIFVCGSRRFSYRQILANISALTNGLNSLGIEKGDKVVAVLLPGIEFVYLFFSLARLGAVMVPLDPQIRARGLTDVLEDAQPVALVAEHAIDKEVLEKAPELHHVIRVGYEGEGTSLAELMETGSSSQKLPPVEPGDLMALMYTSGTTGKPKATMHTHRSLIAPVIASIKVRELWSRPTNLRTAVEVARALTRYRGRLLRSIGHPQTFLSTVGWHTITGLHIMLQGLLMGDRMVVLYPFHPQKALELVQEEHVTVMVATPMAYQVILKLPDLNSYDISSLLVCATGTAPCPPSLARRIQSHFGCALYNGFGMTEAAGGVAVGSLSDSDYQQTETVGRPMVGIDVRVVDDDRRDLPQGQVGELAVRGEGVMLGYYQAPELTDSVLDKDGWYYTGDLVRIDAKGYIHVVGRKKDLIIRGGQNIYPAEIENYLITHPKISEAAVVGIPARVGGESVWAFIRLEEGQEMSPREVLDYCRGVLETYKIPSQVRFVETFPVAQVGKPRKIELREMALQEINGGMHGQN